MTSDRIDTAKEREKLAALEGHTPGPWVTPYDAFKQGWILDTDGDNTQQGIGVAHGQPVAIAGSDSSWKDRLAAANAQLIAAAPDLKATLSAALDALDARDAEIEELNRDCDTADEETWKQGFEAGLGEARITAAQTEQSLRLEIERLRERRIETGQALRAMRNLINEYVPMPSLESDLLQGPEDSVFCLTVAEAVIAEIERLRKAQRQALDACRIIDAAAHKGHDNVGDLILHFVAAVTPARLALNPEASDE